LRPTVQPKEQQQKVGTALSAPKHCWAATIIITIIIAIIIVIIIMMMVASPWRLTIPLPHHHSHHPHHIHQYPTSSPSMMPWAIIISSKGRKKMSHIMST
jgi:hypothetical protein